MIAIDTLVHNFLLRTGILARFNANHLYGGACYRPGGCAYIIAAVADKFRALPDVAARTATLVADKDSSYKMREAFPADLITLPGKSYADSDLIAACAGLILAPPKTADLKQ
jgi:hypothetical protein